MFKMNSAQIHLAINHLPIIIPMVGVGLLGVGLFGRAVVIEKVGLWLLVIGALTAVPTYLSGEPAERIIKNYPGILRAAIQAHEGAE
jgi:uncharacterized membrane protein